MGKNKESRRNAKRWREAAIFGRVELEKMARKISHVMRDEITALLPQKRARIDNNTTRLMRTAI